MTRGSPENNLVGHPSGADQTIVGSGRGLLGLANVSRPERASVGLDVGNGLVLLMKIFLDKTTGFTSICSVAWRPRI